MLYINNKFKIYIYIYINIFPSKKHLKKNCYYNIKHALNNLI